MVNTYAAGVKLSSHFNSSEFRCKCGCGKIMIDAVLIDTLEKLFPALDLGKINVISGYRCAKHDKAVGVCGQSRSFCQRGLPHTRLRSVYG